MYASLLAALPPDADTYTTPPQSQTLFATMFPTAYFYLHLLAAVRSEGCKAAAAPYTGEDWAVGSFKIMRLIERCGAKVVVSGMRHFKELPGPCVFVGNHMSTLETFLLPCCIYPKKNVTFVVKKSLLTYPYFKHVLGSRDPVIVERTNPRQDLAAVMEGGVKRLQQGISIIVFPQSTRSTTLDPVGFNSIGVKLAKKANVPVVPIALDTRAWGMGRIIKDFGPIVPSIPVHFCFGEPLSVSGNGKAEHEAVFSFIQSRLQQWNRTALAAS